VQHDVSPDAQVGHHEHPDTELRPKAIRRLRTTLLIGIVLFLAEALGSWYSHSLALLADSFHVLADLGAVGVTLLASTLAERPQSSKRSYGYYRLEVLAALLNGAILIGLSLYILKSAVERLQMGQTIYPNSMLLIAVFGFIINLWMLLVLKPSHDHNLNLRGAYLHILGDTISSMAVILSALLIVWTGFSWFDAAAGIFVAAIISSLAVRLVWDSVHVLLEGTPKHMDPIEIETQLRESFKEITNIHDFHIWEITAHLFAMTAHIEAKVQTLEESKKLVDGMNVLIKSKYGIGHTTFQIEPSDH
jgi:cobalt-zinc-cadmium efflux system protein